MLEVNPVGAAAPLPDTDATRLLERLREVREDEARALRLHRPALSRLPSPEDFVQFARAEQQAQASVAARHEGRDALAFTPLADAPAPQREALLRALQDLQSQVTTARRRPSAWVPRAVDALLMGQWARWQDLMDRTQDLLPGLQKDAEWMDANVIAGHGGRAPEQIECRRPPEEGSRKACYLVNGPAGVVRKHLDDGLRPALKLLGDWSFTSGTASATYQTQTGRTMNLSVVYGGNDGYTLVDEPVPPGQGTLHVYAAPATP
ncbi:hypothetical protein GCM10010844_32480 [Deinococcus radiotolerans]|uniref:Uncharacterized protein n=1 Tax=Deinococcus radiotolerans TaxID=1309407 RepID=A0ABQ2FNF1_9DEIO|nr:hypothetical protein GCM10010844_32480 [Deinococcus radiotolerans]